MLKTLVKEGKAIRNSSPFSYDNYSVETILKKIQI